MSKTFLNPPPLCLKSFLELITFLNNLWYYAKWRSNWISNQQYYAKNNELHKHQYIRQNRISHPSIDFHKSISSFTQTYFIYFSNIALKNSWKNHVDLNRFNIWTRVSSFLSLLISPSLSPILTHVLPVIDFAHKVRHVSWRINVYFTRTSAQLL